MPNFYRKNLRSDEFQNRKKYGQDLYEKQFESISDIEQMMKEKERGFNIEDSVETNSTLLGMGDLHRTLGAAQGN